MLDTEASQKEKLEEEIGVLRSQLLQMSMEADEVGVRATPVGLLNLSEQMPI